MKKLILLLSLFLFFAVFSANNLYGAWNSGISFIGLSDYVYRGIPFLNHNQVAYMLGVSAEWNKTFSIFPYYAWANDYWEYGAEVWLNFKLGEKTGLGLTAFPFWWQFKGDKKEWGVIYGTELSRQEKIINVKVGLLLSYVPEHSEWNGHYYYLGLNKQIFWGVNLNGEIGYNVHLFTQGKGAVASIKASKTVNLLVFDLDIFLQKYWINQEINLYNEFVIGLTASYGF